MSNAKDELVRHVGDRKVRYVHIIVGDEWDENRRTIAGTLHEVLPLLDFEYDSGYGGQNLFGNIWYIDGTWSERGEYDGSEWWEYKTCPAIPDAATPPRDGEGENAPAEERCKASPPAGCSEAPCTY